MPSNSADIKNRYRLHRSEARVATKQGLQTSIETLAPTITGLVAAAITEQPWVLTGVRYLGSIVSGPVASAVSSFLVDEKYRAISDPLRHQLQTWLVSDNPTAVRISDALIKIGEALHINPETMLSVATMELPPDLEIAFWTHAGGLSKGLDQGIQLASVGGAEQVAQKAITAGVKAVFGDHYTAELGRTVTKGILSQFAKPTVAEKEEAGPHPK